MVTSVSKNFYPIHLKLFINSVINYVFLYSSIAKSSSEQN